MEIVTAAQAEHDHAEHAQRCGAVADACGWLTGEARTLAEERVAARALLAAARDLVDFLDRDPRADQAPPRDRDTA